MGKVPRRPGQARPFCRGAFYFRAPWWMTSSDGRVRQHTHTWESLAATHMAVSSSFTALANRLFFSFTPWKKEVPRTHICNPRSSYSFYSSSGLLVVVIDQHFCILFGINFFSLSSGCCCGCSFLFLLQLLFPYWLTSFPLGLSNSPGICSITTESK